MKNSKINLCIVDNAFLSPATAVDFDPKKKFCFNAIKHLINDINRSEWDEAEQAILELLSELVANDLPQIEISAYSHPTFLLDAIENGYSPDIVIFDYDYGSDVDDVEELLEEIVHQTFCFVYVFSAYDKGHEIKALIQSDPFQKQAHRMEYLGKDEDESVKKLLRKIDELKRTRFSFQFGTQIKTSAISTVDQILINLGRYGIEKVGEILGEDNNDLVEFIGERFKNDLIKIKFDQLLSIDSTAEADIIQETESVDTENEVHKELWKYRLYSSTGDGIVRKGDICKIDDKYYLILTPDCELYRFGQKTMGILNIVELIPTSEKERLVSLIIKSKNVNRKLRDSVIKGISSLSNPVNLPANPILLPFVEDEDLLLFPKLIGNIQFDLPAVNADGAEPDKPLEYSKISNSEKVVSLSEPFLSPVLDHIFSSLRGYGTPDYSDTVKKIIPEKLIESLKND